MPHKSALPPSGGLKSYFTATSAVAVRCVEADVAVYLEVALYIYWEVSAKLLQSARKRISERNKDEKGGRE